MSWVGFNYCILAVFLSFNLISCVGLACFNSHEKIGETTLDFELPVGADLTINCSLENASLQGFKNSFNSSYLAFRSDNRQKILDNTYPIDTLTAQLRIPNVQENHSDVYNCILINSDGYNFVCSTNVNVGYPPKEVTNFKCISRNFDNLTCTWDIEPNHIRTEYTVSKTMFYGRILQDCPIPHNNTYCLWTEETTPPYYSLEGNLTFVLRGNNSLGSIEMEFTYDHYAIVVPNSPENFTVLNVKKNSVLVQWSAPRMERKSILPPLYYQLRLQELGPEPGKKVVIEAGVNTSHFLLEHLIPNYQYKISLRCRLNSSALWSSFVSIVFKTNPDVPYLVPEVNPSAFVLHNFGVYRNTTLYWKPVAQRYHFGDDFHYHVVYSQVKEASSTFIAKSKTPFVKIGYLHNDTAYEFRIHSANNEGISENFTTMVIDGRENILPSAKDIRAISNGIGKYNLSWEKIGTPYAFNYTVFWCISRKPGHCDGPIQWTDGVLKESAFSLNVPDVNSNFQFAIAASHGNRSSGMQWASCVVPVKAPLGQIPISHIEPSSTALRIMWKLDCEAQKSVIDRYVITYCKESRDCQSVEVESDASNYTLSDLRPFSEYSIKLRAFNKENKPSEDVDEMHRSTLSSAPSDSPRNVAIISKSNSSVLISWTPPMKPNGVITDYFIYHNEQKDHAKEGSCKSCVFHVKGLKEYTVYNISVEACVEAEDMKNLYCSPKSQPITILTDVGVPGKMEAPRIETVNITHLKVSWPAPTVCNGPIEFYEVHWRNVAGNETDDQTIQEPSLSTYIDFECPNLLEGGLTYQFYVRAVNKKNGTFLYGPFSDPIKATTCVMSRGLAMIIGVAIGGTFALVIFLLFSYKLVIWMSHKIHQVKNIAVRLPKELEGPETNPLNNYESFKNGLVHTIHNGKVEHPSYALNESDNKNRHGSGSSQFSTVSTDELIFKNGKCTKFGRKPSGDSSGCSSMTSNTTTRLQLSSDSGTESDFMVPPSPDSISNELSASGQKPHMPILMEVHDPPETVSQTHPKTGANDYLEKYNFVNGMVLKVDHPYSKFGISGNVTSCIPCQINPLAFYSGNLANSEPSVFEAQATSMRKPPGRPLYSKLGFAKSSSDILGISATSKEIGYSKFGFDAPQDCFSIDVEKLNSVVGASLVEDPFYLKQSTPNGFMSKDNIYSDSQDLKQEEFVDSGQKKMSFVCNRPSSGYVQVGDIRCMQEANVVSSSTSSLDEDDSPLEIPRDLSYDISDHSSVWTTGLFQLPPTDDFSFLNDTGHPRNGGPTLATSSSPSSGSLHIVPSQGVRVTDRTFASEDLSHLQDTLPMCDSVTPSTNPNGYGLESRFGMCSPSPEVLLSPCASKNGYVPFSTLSSMCDPPVSIVPMTADSNVPLSIFPGGDIGSDQNYITPSNKSELKLLQDGLVSNSKPFSPLLHCNGSKMRQMSSPLKHILKPMPKMESEICEV